MFGFEIFLLKLKLDCTIFSNNLRFNVNIRVSNLSVIYFVYEKLKILSLVFCESYAESNLIRTVFFWKKKKSIIFKSLLHIYVVYTYLKKCEIYKSKIQRYHLFTIGTEYYFQYIFDFFHLNPMFKWRLFEIVERNNGYG